MGYYCTVPQCTSLAGKTKNVKFHRFPRDVAMADKWNIVLKRGKPYTKYSKVCSLHFTQGDYNVTTMGQWKTLSKDAVPSQNLPKLNPDGTVMVIRKSRTIKYREGKKDETEKTEKPWQPSLAGHSMMPGTPDTPMGVIEHDSILAYRLQNLGTIANAVAPQQPMGSIKPKKQDAIMQTDPVASEDGDTQPNNSYSEVSEKSYSSEMDQYQSYPKIVSPYPKDASPYPKDVSPYPKDASPYPKDASPYPKDASPYPKDASPYPKDASPYPKDASPYPKDAYPREPTPYQKESPYKEPYPREQTPYKNDYKDTYPKDSFAKDTFQKDQKDTFEPKDYTKSSDYIPQTNEEYNKEAEKYALERKAHNGYDLKEYQKHFESNYQRINDLYSFNRDYYQNGYPDSVGVLKNQQHNLQILQEQHRLSENQNFFNENHIKQEIDISGDDDKYMYERSKEQLESNSLYADRRLHNPRYLDQIQQQVKQEPDASNGCEPAAPGSPYYPGAAYYEARPGPELLIAKQNALAAHTQLWQNTMKRPFYYSDSTHYNAPQLLHRYEDIPRILQ